MREIKFRVKRLSDGQWLYGLPLQIPSHRKAGILMFMERKTGSTYEVDPQTLGQYTGLKDKNGVEIYEGDRLKWWNTTPEKPRWHKSEVIWDEDVMGWEPFATRFDNEHWDKCEVIGNIYENQELLEGKEQYER